MHVAGCKPGNIVGKNLLTLLCYRLQNQSTFNAPQLRSCHQWLSPFVASLLVTCFPVSPSACISTVNRKIALDATVVGDVAAAFRLT